MFFFVNLFDVDVSSTTIKLTMDGVFDSAYNNPQSSPYKELENRVITAVSLNKKLKKYFDCYDF